MMVHTLLRRRSPPSGHDGPLTIWYHSTRSALRWMAAPNQFEPMAARWSPPGAEPNVVTRHPLWIGPVSSQDRRSAERSRNAPFSVPTPIVTTTTPHRVQPIMARSNATGGTEVAPALMTWRNTYRPIGGPHPQHEVLIGETVVDDNRAVPVGRPPGEDLGLRRRGRIERRGHCENHEGGHQDHSAATHIGLLGWEHPWSWPGRPPR